MGTFRQFWVKLGNFLFHLPVILLMNDSDNDDVA